jgi:hypothetical protein
MLHDAVKASGGAFDHPQPRSAEPERAGRKACPACVTGEGKTQAGYAGEKMSSPQHEGCLETTREKLVTTAHPNPILHQQPFTDLSLRKAGFPGGIECGEGRG